MLVNQIKRGPLCARIWKRADQTDRLVRRAPPTTDGMRLKTTRSTTRAALESLAATARDDGDSVGVTSADDESGNAWSDDNDDI